MAEIAALAAAGATALVSCEGAELRSWQPAGGPELMWHGDPAHWAFWAPLLFPIVGALKDSQYRWRGKTYEMFRHGFTRFRPFRPLEVDGGNARFLLTDDEQTRAEYPFAFRLTATYALTAHAIELQFTVGNPGPEPMPYAVGWHPAFLWPFAGGDKEEYRMAFDADEAATIPAFTPGGLVRRDPRPSPLVDRGLALRPALFPVSAFVFPNARSKAMAFTARDGSAIVFSAEDMPHLVVWTKPTSPPFVSLEAWTALPDPEDAEGDLAAKPGMRWLPPGESARHAARVSWRPPR
jgi:galactose mutarotase-like enzyme